MRAQFGLPSVRNGLSFNLHFGTVHTDSASVDRGRCPETPLPDQRQIRDTVLHSLGHTGSVLEGGREKWIPGSPLGAIYHSKRR